MTRIFTFFCTLLLRHPEHSRGIQARKRRIFSQVNLRLRPLEKVSAQPTEEDQQIKFPRSAKPFSAHPFSRHPERSRGIQAPRAAHPPVILSCTHVLGLRRIQARSAAFYYYNIQTF